MIAFWNGAAGYFWQDEIPYLMVMVAALAILLFRNRPEIRKTLYNTLGLFLLSLAGQFLSGIIHALGFATAAAILHEVFLILAGVAIIRLWGLLIFRVLLPLARLAPPSILEDILIMMGYVAWGLVRLRYAGMDLSGIVTTSAVITAVIAFAMQDTLGNILGGLAIQLDDSIQIGDWIKLDDVTGRVVDIRWRSTSIETRNWETVMIPNSMLMKNKFTVLGRRSGEPLLWRRSVAFNVGFSVAPSRVISTVDNAIREAEIDNVALTPEPTSVLLDFESGYGRYVLRYWLTDFMLDDPTDTAIRSHIYAALQRAGVRLAVPEHDVHITKEDQKHEEIVQMREMARRLKALQPVDLFSKFSEDELRTVAERLKYSPYAKGNIITKQGSTSHWLYILTSGEAEVFLETPGEGRRSLGILAAGNFFGEMGLMTGAPRTATVIARSDVECYRLDKASFEDILHSRPSIAEEITQILVSRRAALDLAQHDIEAQRRGRAPAQQHSEILEKIKRFFGLGAER